MRVVVVLFGVYGCKEEYVFWFRVKKEEEGEDDMGGLLFSSRRRHTRFALVSWARTCV